jgi:hypothetical protein
MDGSWAEGFVFEGDELFDAIVQEGYGMFPNTIVFRCASKGQWDPGGLVKDRSPIPLP